MAWSVTRNEAIEYHQVWHPSLGKKMDGFFKSWTCQRDITVAECQAAQVFIAQDFNGNIPLEMAVISAVNGSHSPASQTDIDAVAIQQRRTKHIYPGETLNKFFAIIAVLEDVNPYVYVCTAIPILRIADVFCLVYLFSCILTRC